MKYSEARFGRVFVIRLEDGEILHEAVEKLAAEKDIKAAALIVLGAVGRGSRLVVAPEDPAAERIKPMEYLLDNVHEVTGVGTVFLNEKGKHVSHMHIASGRWDSTVTGCVRKGVRVWRVVEIILFELLDTGAMRRIDPDPSGFELLVP
ncbi:MAG: DNA-binding protein [Euryarchaeota archaeon]|nr:DNA-binding protein [Euryarchaeota archaeon]